jgi:PD-(D/E)XK endonuclease
MEWLVRSGAVVFVPIGHSPDCDLIANWGDRVERVQVKTTSGWRNSRWEVRVSTCGGNQSWNGIHKYLDPSRCDQLFVHVADGRRWFIPAHAFGGGSMLRLGGPKYAEFEVERGYPLHTRSPYKEVLKR